MLNKIIVCPVCKIPLQDGTSVCPDCKQDLSALIYLDHQSEILYNQGLSLAQAGKDEQAIDALKKALNLDKTNLLAALVLGKIYAQRKEYEAAKAIWEQAQRANPESTELRDQLAILDDEIEAAHDRESQVKLESEQKEKDARMRKVLRGIAQLGLAFILGCAALAAYQLIFQYSKPGQPTGLLAQVDISTLQAFQTAVAITMDAPQLSFTPSTMLTSSPSKTPTPSLTPTSVLLTATTIPVSSIVSPTVTPTVQDLLPLVEQAIARDPGLVGLGLKFVQNGRTIDIAGEVPDIRTRYLIEMIVRSVPGVELIDMSGLRVLSGDITVTVSPSYCVVTTGIKEGHVYLRSGPGIRNKIIRVLSEGESLSINLLGEWYQVTTSEGVTGWIYSRFCKTK